MKSLQRGIVLLCQTVMWLTTAVIFLILCANTVLRYASGTSLQWGAELPELLFPWLVMAGVVLGAAKGSHITTTFLVETLPEATRRWISVGVWLTVAGLYGTLASATWSMLEIVADERSPILGVPGSVTYGCVMVGLGMLAALALVSAWEAFRGSLSAATPALSEARPEMHIA